MAYLSAHPDIRQKLRADIHMDMVGGDLFKNKSVLHVTPNALVFADLHHRCGCVVRRDHS